MALGTLVSGKLSDMYPTMQHHLQVAALATCLQALFSSLLPQALEIVDSYYTAQVMVAGYGLATGAVVTLSPLLIVEVVGVSERVPQALGLYSAMYGLTGMLGPPFGGLLHDWCHDYNLAFLGSGTAMLLSALGFFLIRQTNSAELRIRQPNKEELPIGKTNNEELRIHQTNNEELRDARWNNNGRENGPANDAHENDCEHSSAHKIIHPTKNNNAIMTQIEMERLS